MHPIKTVTDLKIKVQREENIIFVNLQASPPLLPMAQ